MRILGHIHTLNDADVIERSLAALQAQTVPLDEILIVDNGSTDGTLDLLPSGEVTIVRHKRNSGTNGSVRTGFQYALDNGFDWIWVFDADSAPRPDALAMLLDLYDRLEPEEASRICFLGCRAMDFSEPETVAHEAVVFTTHNLPERAVPESGRDHYRCDANLWSGSLFRADAIRQLGLPSPYYVLDFGELEYGYRAYLEELTSYIDSRSIMFHDLGGAPALIQRSIELGPFAITLYEMPPVRCYYRSRNPLYFWIYEHRRRNLRTVIGAFLRAALLVVSFGVRPFSRSRQFRASLLGLWHGVTGNLKAEYDPALACNCSPGATIAGE